MTMYETASYDYDAKINIPVEPSRQSTRKNQKRIYIETSRSSTHPKNIGLHLNTNVHIIPKKRPDFKKFLITFLLCVCIGQGISNYFKDQEIVVKLDFVERNLERMEEGLEILTDVMENMQNTIQRLKFENSMLKGESNHSINKRETDEQMLCSSCANGTRHARAIGRGKHHHSKNRNGCHSRCYRTSGPYSIHLRGALAETSVRDGGIVGPWYIDKTSTGSFLLADGIVGEKKGIFEVVEEGLYFIYAQMYYLTSSSLNSYTINLQLGASSDREDIVVAVCSAEAATNKLSELSCYTAVVRYLHQGDRIYVTQRERNRRIIFRENKSFLGLTLLNSAHDFI